MNIEPCRALRGPPALYGTLLSEFLEVPVTLGVQKLFREVFSAKPGARSFGIRLGRVGGVGTLGGGGGCNTVRKYTLTLF